MKWNAKAICANYAFISKQEMIIYVSNLAKWDDYYDYDCDIMKIKIYIKVCMYIHI